MIECEFPMTLRELEHELKIVKSKKCRNKSEEAWVKNRVWLLEENIRREYKVNPKGD